tara:strand:- start:15647 stop:15865 length:219 start_codon:yes stop_codon:yes gene_type:complete
MKIENEAFNEQMKSTYWDLYNKHGPGILEITVVEKENRCDVNYILEENWTNEHKQIAEDHKESIPLIFKEST